MHFANLRIEYDFDTKVENEIDLVQWNTFKIIQ